MTATAPRLLPTAALLALACGAASATEYGTVTSSHPVTAQVAVPQPQCYQEQVAVPQRTSGAGALTGAVIGGVIGNAVGGGGGLGRTVAAGMGAIVGAAVGDNAEAAGTPPAAATVQRCQTTMHYETRTVGYDVQYDYNGQHYAARLPQDPGAQIALDVNVSPAGGAQPPSQPQYTQPYPQQSQSQAPVYSPAPQVAYAPPVVYAPAPVVYAPPAYGYYGYYGAPLVTFGPRIFIGGGWHHGWGR